MTSGRQVSHRLANVAFGLALGIVTALYGLALCGNLQEMIGDTSEYVTFARLVADGKVPYHDFMAWTTPVWIYLYAAVLKVLGMSYFTLVVFSILLGIGSGFFLFLTAKEIAGRWAGVVAMGLLAAYYPIAMEMGRIYYTAPSMFFLLAGICADQTIRKRSLAILLATLGFTLAAGSMQSYGLAIPAYLFYLLITERNKKMLALGIAGFAVFGVLTGGYFLLIDAPRTFWNLFSYSGFWAKVKNYDVTSAANLGSVIQAIRTFPLIWYPALLSLVLIAVLRRFKPAAAGRMETPALRRFNTLFWIFLLALCVPNILLNFTKDTTHHAYYLAIVCLGAAVNLVRIFVTVDSDRLRWALAASCLLFIFLPVNFNGVTPVSYVYRYAGFLQTYPYAVSPSIDKAVSVLKEIKGDKHAPQIFSFIPYAALWADGRLFPGTESRYNTFIPDCSDTDAQSNHLYNLKMALSWISLKQADIILLTEKDYQSLECCGAKGSREAYREIEKALSTHYRLRKEVYLNVYWGNARLFTPR